MALQAGFRSYEVIEVGADALTTVDTHGASVIAEVTNAGASTALVYINDFPESGHTSKGGIPVLAGTTRQIPMTVYNLRSTQPVTVVAYRL